MKVIYSLLVFTLVLGLITSTAPAAQNSAASAGMRIDQRSLAVPDPSLVLHGGKDAGLAKQGVTEWNIYGGSHPDGINDNYPEGEFQEVNWFPTLQNWTSHDLTEAAPIWHISEFNASNLDAGSPNHAMFSGVEAGEPGFASAPGYGHNMNDWLDWSVQVNPTINTSVRLSFEYNHDTEPDYDFFMVEYDSAGVMKPLLMVSGDNRDLGGEFTTPASFDETKLFTPLMYSGSPRINIHLRLRVTSDGAWSDEDGFWDSDGAAQVDNIAVRLNGSLATQHGDGIASFEGPAGAEDVDGWVPTPSSFVGDFGRLWPQISDIDPCRINETPQIGFVDDGTAPNNSTISTGGSTSPNWSYGIPGGYVVNYDGGLSGGTDSLHNEFWSPEIPWDDPSTTLDDGLQGGGRVQFTVWSHLPLLNGMFWVWHVRSFPDDTGNWSPWLDRNFVYYSGNAVYNSTGNDVSDLLVENPQSIQIALGVMDLATIFDFAGTDATASPFYDDVSFWKYGADGPAFTTRNIDLFQDAFPQGGSIDYDADPSQLPVRIDSAKDITPAGGVNTAGDSIVVDVVSVIPGTDLNGPGPNGRPVMRWALDTNPAFDGVRVLPAGAALVATSSRGTDVYMGTAEGDSARTPNGSVVDNRFFFDAPNDGPAIYGHQTAEPAMFFPGDIFRYFIEADDSGGNTTSLPADTTGFHSGAGYNRVFTVRALPTLFPDGGSSVVQPDLLVINDFGHRGGEDEFLTAFDQNGLFEGVDYDTYTVQGPSSMVGNGIGSAGVHGANDGQLAGYDCIIYFSGDLSSGLISDGTGQGGNGKSNDIATLSSWHGQPADRYMAYFGDNLASGMENQGLAAQSYVINVMGVDVISSDVRSLIQDQVAPIVSPTGSGPLSFGSEFVAYGGCLSINDFDHIEPLIGAGAVASHGFYDKTQSSLLAPAASVWYERIENITGTDYTRVDLTFPYGFLYVQDTINTKAPANSSARAVLLEEILASFGRGVLNGAAVGNPSSLERSLRVAQNVPNPFNPSTDIRFTAPTSGRVSVRVFNLRGELVAEIFDGKVEAQIPVTVSWHGRDAGGAQVASGVYLYRVEGMGFSETRKMALVK